MSHRASNTSPLLNTCIAGIAGETPTLIDSGASTNFLDLTYARKRDIPLIKLDSLINVDTIDGKNISKMIQFKAFISVEVEGHIFKKQKVYCMATGESP